MSVLTAFLKREPAEGVRVQSLGTVLLLRGEPVAYWLGDTLCFTQGIQHTLEAHKLLKELGDRLDVALFYVARPMGSVKFYEFKRIS